MSKFPRLVVSGTHSSGKNYTSRILYELGFRNFLQEPLSPLSPPGIWLGKKSCLYTYCDTRSPKSKQALIKACNEAVVRAYEAIRARHPRILPGYSSHDLASLGSMLAVAGGARMIEKHVKLHDVEWVHFDKVAIDLVTDDFARFASDVRTAELIVGSGEKRVLEREHHKYSVATDS
jgi:hypothetical protein